MHFVVFNDSGLDAIDDHAPHAKLADDFVEWPSAYEKFLSRVCYEPTVSCISELFGSRRTKAV